MGSGQELTFFLSGVGGHLWAVDLSVVRGTTLSGASSPAPGRPINCLVI